MKHLVFGLLISSLSLLPLAASADHPPKRLLRNFMAFSQLGEIGKLAEFDVNVAVYGAPPSAAVTAVPNAALDQIFADKFNLAAIVLKGDEVVYERYNSEKNIDSNTLLMGMSMSKTAAAAAVGALLCDGKIKSLDDKAGAYSSFLKTIPHGDVSIKNILHMNSGVSPIGRSDEKRFNRKARGVAKFAFVFQGHGGQFLVLNDANDTVLLTLSFNESYAAGNLFKDIARFAEKLD